MKKLQIPFPAVTLNNEMTLLFEHSYYIVEWYTIKATEDEILEYHGNDA
jgi:hypothetical protein